MRAKYDTQRCTYCSEPAEVVPVFSNGEPFLPVCSQHGPRVGMNYANGLTVVKRDAD